MSLAPTIAKNEILHEGQSAYWFGMVLLLIKKELKVRYKGSIVGYFWSMINPLLSMCILAFVFSFVVRFEQKNYPLFILAGILVWNLFSQGVSLGTGAIVNNASLMKKVKVSATIFTAASVGSCVVNFLLALLPFYIVYVFFVKSFPLYSLALPLLLFPLAIFTYGIGLALGSLNVCYRDVQHMLDPILNMVFYATPIIYPAAVLPEKFQTLLAFNPLYYFVTPMRDLLYSNHWPDLKAVGVSYALAVMSLCFGVLVYSKTRKRFIYRF